MDHGPDGAPADAMQKMNGFLAEDATGMPLVLSSSSHVR
jgi:hypothetical protein